METFVRILLRNRGLAAGLIVASLAVSAFLARSIQLRFQFRDFYDYPGNASLELFKRDNDMFGDPAGYVVAMIEADDVFHPDVLGYVSRLTRALQPAKEFSRIRSLANVNAVRGAGDEVVAGQLMPSVPESPEALQALRKFVLENPLYVRRLVSADGTATAVLGDMRVPAAFATIAQQQAATQAFQRVLEREPRPAGVRVRLTGAPTVEIAVTDAIIEDQLLLVPAVCLALGLMLYLTFRAMHGVLLCLASVSVALIWTAAIFATIGRPVDMIGSVIPTTMLVYGVVDPIFVLARFFGKVDAGRPKNEAIIESLVELARPCFLTSLTTAVGFGAFVTCVAPSVKFYGLTVGIGVLLSFVTTITVLPLLLSLVPLPKRRAAGTTPTRLVDRGFLWFGTKLRTRVGLAAFAAVAILVLGGWFARAQLINNQYTGQLPAGETKDNVRALEEKLAGVIRLIVHIEGAEDSMRRPEVLRAMEKVDRAMEQRPEVTYSGSLADLVAAAHQAFQGGDAEHRMVPNSRALIAQYLTMTDPQDRAEYVTDDYSKAHIAILLKDGGSHPTKANVDVLQRVVDESFAGLGVKAEITGHGIVAYRELDGVVVELLWGFVTAFAAVILLEWLLYRSLRLALLTIIPNLVPVAVCFLTTRAMGVPLRIDTILVLCVSIGGLFNTTIHYVARVLHHERRGTANADDVMIESLRTIGPPSLFTAVILSVGFALFVLSSFPGLQLLGLLSTITLMSGFAADMLFTPSLIRLFYRWKPAADPTEDEASGRPALTAS